MTRGRATREGPLTGGSSLSGAAMRACERAAEADVRGARIGLKAGRKRPGTAGLRDAGPGELLGPREGAGPLRVVLGRPRGLGRTGHWAEQERSGLGHAGLEGLGSPAWELGRSAGLRGERGKEELGWVA